MIYRARVRRVFRHYKKNFKQRGGVTPEDPLEYHLHHLALYWSRLVGFCHQMPESVDACIKGDLGACVQVGTKWTATEITNVAGAASSWVIYSDLVRKVLKARGVSVEQVDEAAEAYDEVMRVVGYDPGLAPRTSTKG